jgi:hypothetical protein
MTDHNNAAQAAEQDPLSDEYVNAVIRQHGYGHPTAVAARLWQWIGLPGSENGVTLLIYEAHKALSKLRAESVQAGDEDAPPIAPDDEAISEAWITASDCDGIAYDGPSFERGYRAALASAPVAGEPFMYGIMGPDRKAHFEEFCVSGDRSELQTEVVDHLNRDNPEDGTYSVVALFREPAPQASEAVPRAGYAGVTVWIGDRQATQVVTKQMLASPNVDELSLRFEAARAALSPTQPSKDGGGDA